MFESFLRRHASVNETFESFTQPIHPKLGFVSGAEITNMSEPLQRTVSSTNGSLKLSQER